MSDPSISPAEIAAAERARRREIARANAAGPAPIPASETSPSRKTALDRFLLIAPSASPAPAGSTPVLSPAPSPGTESSSQRWVLFKNSDAFRLGLFSGLGFMLAVIAASLAASVLSMLILVLMIAFGLRHR